jgi:AcrR family transcriptional regulator
MRAGVAKQTIYRWWFSKTDILLESHADDATEHFTALAGNDLGSDLRAHLRELAVFLTETDAGAVWQALVGHAQHDPAVRGRFEADAVSAQRDRVRAPLIRAVERGELPRTEDIDLATDQLVGPIYYRVLVTHEPVPTQFTDALVARYLDGRTGGGS